MMTHGYSQLYLGKASSKLGVMLQTAVVEFGMDGGEFLKLFIQSGLATAIEEGSPKYLSGRSGLELFMEVMELTTGENREVGEMRTFDRGAVYWAGWLLTHYQWYSGRTFKNILKTTPYDELLRLYYPLHEADVTKCYDVLDARHVHSVSKLKVIRRRCGLTQGELAEMSGISVNTIRAYERKSKDLNKARVDGVLRLARLLQCKMDDLLD